RVGAADLGDGVLEGVVRRLARPVPVEQAGLPAAEAVLVDQAEVEEAGDGRLAIREQDRVLELSRLVDARGRDGWQRVVVVLTAVVIAHLVARRNGLEAVLDVPDRHAAVAGEGLSRLAEGG